MRVQLPQDVDDREVGGETPGVGGQRRATCAPSGARWRSARPCAGRGGTGRRGRCPGRGRRRTRGRGARRIAWACLPPATLEASWPGRPCPSSANTTRVVSPVVGRQQPGAAGVARSRTPDRQPPRRGRRGRPPARPVPAPRCRRSARLPAGWSGCGSAYRTRPPGCTARYEVDDPVAVSPAGASGRRSGRRNRRPAGCLLRRRARPGPATGRPSFRRFPPCAHETAIRRKTPSGRPGGWFRVNFAASRIVGQGNENTMDRSSLADAHRIVIKLGTHVVTQRRGRRWPSIA